MACGSVPGSRRFSPSSVAIDQLLCLPEPLMPANGFSWIRNASPCRGASFRIVDITSMLWSDPTDVGSNTGAISNWPGATSLWRVLAGMPRRHSSRSRSIMNARIRWRIGPKYWSSSSWPLGGVAPNRVRPVSSRSGRCSASRRSTRKYSCSGPMVVNTRSVDELPNQRRTRSACLPRASCERSSGILWSSASPVNETYAVGIVIVTPFGSTWRKIGEVTSHAV